MTRELAMVHAREGIRFNSLCPYVTPSILSLHFLSHIYSSSSADH